MDRDLAQLRALFDEVIQAPPAARPDLLAARCGSDSDLKRRVEALIATAESDGPFLSQPTRSPASMETAQALSERPGTRIGPYKLLQQIGEGGFGVVFMAEQDRPVRRRVALKIIKLGMDTRQVVARFEQERQALALMDHPNIARVFDAGATDSGRPYFVMEYVKGDPITEFADAHRLSVPDRLRLFVQVCAAVQHAHTKGVVHRDIKPRNVLASMTDGRPFAKVIDFGIAKATGARLTEKTLFTEHRQLIGTPEYMSPEQAEGSPDIDTRTDVYSLGVLLYELLTGATPFDADRLRSAAFAEMQRIIKEEEPPAPSVRVSRSLDALAATAAARGVEPDRLGVMVRGELDWIVMKALDKDRARRFESPSQLAADAERYLAGEPVAAAPPSAAYRARKFVRRHRGPVAAGAAVAAALVMGIVATSIGFVSEARQRREAVSARMAERQQREAAERARAAAELARLAEAEAVRVAEARRAEAELNAYTANIFAAAHDPLSARRRLDACPERLRGWEWRFLDASSDLSLSVMHAPKGHQWTASAFSPDGSLFALGSTREVALCETATGRRVGTIEVDGWISEIEFSPDGKRLRMKMENNTEAPHAIWSLDTLEPMTLLPESDYGRCSPDGERVLVWNLDRGEFRMVEAATGRVLHERKAHGRISLSGAGFFPDGARFVTIGDERDADGEFRWSAKVWHTATCEVERTLTDQPGTVFFTSIAFSPDGRHVAISADENGVMVWDGETGELRHTFEHTEEYLRLRFSGDGRVLYGGPWYWTSTWSYSGYLWNLESGTLVRRITGGDDPILHGEFTADGERIVASLGAAVGVWDVRSGAILGRLAGHSDEWVRVRVGPDGSRFLSTAWDGTARLWDSATPTNPTAVKPDLPGGIAINLAHAPNDDRILTTDTHGNVCISDAFSGRTLAAFAHEPAAGRWVPEFFSASFIDGGERVLTLREEEARIWDSRAGRLEFAVALPPRGEYSVRAETTPDGSRLVLGRGDGAVWVVDLVPPAGRRVLELTGDGWACVAISPDGSLVAVGWRDPVVHVYDAATGNRVREIAGLGARANSIRFDSTGARIVTIADDRTVHRWDIASGEGIVLGRPSVGESAAWDSIAAFDRAGERVIIIEDNAARVHDMASGVLIAVLRGHRWWIENAVFTNDESRIVTASADRTVRFWDPATGNELLVLTVPSTTDEGVLGPVFSPDGTRLMAAGNWDDSVTVFDTVPYRDRIGARSRGAGP